MGKILITGTGRSGTSFLVHLLSALGMDTGYTEDECFHICNNACQGGAEWTIEKPYKILKNPEFMVKIEDIVQNYDIDHVIIPIRNLEDTAKSRENNSENHGGFGGYCFNAHNLEEQETNNARLFYEMIEILTRYDVPFTTIAFPHMIEYRMYLYRKLKSTGLFDELEGKEEQERENNFFDTHKRIANPDKITIK